MLSIQQELLFFFKKVLRFTITLTAIHFEFPFSQSTSIGGLKLD